MAEGSEPVDAAHGLPASQMDRLWGRTVPPALSTIGCSVGEDNWIHGTSVRFHAPVVCAS